MDNQGTIRDLIDSTGTILNHISYDAFGQVTGETNPDVDFRFGYTGREFDEETGQYYYRARYYDSGVGRFISEDPIGFSGGDANLYRYVFNSPTQFIDPSGNIAFVIALPAAAPYIAAGATVVVGGVIAAGPIIEEGIERANNGTLFGGSNFDLNPPESEGLGSNEINKGNNIPRSLSDLSGHTGHKPVAVGDLRLGGFAEGEVNVRDYTETFPRGSFGDLIQHCFSIGSTVAMQRGRESEARILEELGLPSNTQRVSSPEGNAIPDALNDDVSIEIKDTQRVTNTRQIRIQTDAARESGKTSILITGKNTRVSNNAEASFDLIIRRPDIGP